MHYLSFVWVLVSVTLFAVSNFSLVFWSSTYALLALVRLLMFSILDVWGLFYAVLGLRSLKELLFFYLLWSRLTIDIFLVVDLSPRISSSSILSMVIFVDVLGFQILDDLLLLLMFIYRLFQIFNNYITMVILCQSISI